MKGFSEYNPAVVALVIFSITGVAMFTDYPVFSALTLTGGMLYYTIRIGRDSIKGHPRFLALFLILALASPLISHNGRTVLFVLNDNPVTLEALLYGVNSAASMVGALYWLLCFTQMMTSDKLLYITGRLSPKLSLVLSMALRSVPLYQAQAKKIRDAQKAMGLFKDDNIIDDILGNMRIFSALATWALENGIITADSMAAKGYGICRRTQFSAFRFGTADVILLIADIVLLTASAFAAYSVTFVFYPDITAGTPDIAGVCGLTAYGILVLLPSVIETEASLRWNYLQSKI